MTCQLALESTENFYFVWVSEATVMGTGGAGKVGAGIGFNNLPIQQTKVFKKNLAAKRNKKNSQSIPAI